MILKGCICNLPRPRSPVDRMTSTGVESTTDEDHDATYGTEYTSVSMPYEAQTINATD